MSASSVSAIARPDACPGVLRPHQAVDGALVRIRLPGGRISPAALRAVAGAAVRLGDGHLEPTSRGNLQLRGLAPGTEEALTAVLRDAGLLPSPVHERARNIAASPLSGLDGRGHGDVSALVAALDARLCADAAMAELSGRFLFALDDGRGDVAALGGDLCWQAVSPTSGALLVAGSDSGVRVGRDGAVEALLSSARSFLRLRGGDPAVWRVADLPGGAMDVVAAVRAALPATGTAAEVLSGNRAEPPRPGVVLRGAERTARLITAPFGRLSAAQARLIADTAGAAPLRVTPWRCIAVPGAAAGSRAAETRMRAAGLVVDEESPWAGVSACAGPTGCAKATADVRADAARAVALRSADPSGGRRSVHWSGCGRTCGRPSHEHIAAVSIRPGEYEIGPVAGLSSPASAEAAPARVAEMQGTM